MASNEVLNEIVAEEKLVEIWPDHPCLYDVRSADFKNRDKRQKALEEIAIAVNQNGNNAHELFICLLTLYNSIQVFLHNNRKVTCFYILQQLTG